MNEVLEHSERNECVAYNHEWPWEAAPAVVDSPHAVKDAHGNIFADGDCLVRFEDLKLGGSSVLTGGSKSKAIRLMDGDHEIGRKVDAVAVMLKECFVKKA
jgi:protein PhnA